MNLINHPDLIDRLASGYALGTLRGGARRRFETLARQHPSVRVAALTWQARVVSLGELQPQAKPAAAVWTRIDNLVQGEQQAQAMQAARTDAAKADATKTTPIKGWFHNLSVWRGLTAAGALASVVAITGGVVAWQGVSDIASQRAQQLQANAAEISKLQTALLATPQIEYVAVLADDKSAASMLVTFDAKSKRLTLQRVGGYAEATDRSLQLWALPPAGGPRSLGVLGNDKVLRLAAADADVREVPNLAISLEPKGGVPSAGGPTGPVLFKGALIQKVL